MNNYDEEIWKDIEGFGGDYQISSLGRVKSFQKSKKGKILKQSKDKDGYFWVTLYKNKKPKCKRIHVLIFSNFKCKVSDNYIVHHIDENKNNNNLNNLKLMDNKKHGQLHNIGKKHPEHSERMSGKNNPMFGKHENHPMFGRHQSEGTKKKIRENSPSQKGELNNTSKLKNGEVWLIKKILNSDYYISRKISQEFIGKMFGVKRTTITDIKSGKTWGHIKYE